jgi:hypothetical protein
MHLPGFTAGAALYESKRHYYAGWRGAIIGPTVLPQDFLGIGQGPLPPCFIASVTCANDAKNYEWDAHGQCDWYQKHCVAPPSQGSGPGGGGDCAQGVHGGMLCYFGPAAQ